MIIIYKMQSYGRECDDAQAFVYFQVSHQVRFHIEGGRAQGARVQSFILVGGHMLLQVAAGRERLAAQVTLVVLLARVHAPVHDQAILTGKLLAAIVALKRKVLFGRVHGLRVVDERGLLSELVVAQLARIRQLLPVDSLMDLERGPGEERLLAMVARVIAHVAVRQHVVAQRLR